MADKKVILESGIEVDAVYAPPGAERPGEFPYTRGIHPQMYRARPWTMRQYAGFGTPEQTNARFKFLIGRGQNALNVAFDLPTQMGLDSDDPEAEGEVGRVGMAVDTLADMETALDGIDLRTVSTALTINAPACVLVAMLLAAAEKRGVPPASVRGTAQNDILKEFIGRGAWIFPVEPSVRLVGDLMEFCARGAPEFHAVSVCGYHVRESGAAPHQEIGYAFEIARAYVDEVRRRGLDIDAFVPRVSFNFNVYGNLWEQVAKFRAGRRAWAKLVRDELGAKDPKSMQLKMIAGGGGSGLTVEEPENNIVRGAYYALIGALGGAQTMALCCYDEAYTIPSERASLLSLRTMQVLAEEMGMCDTADPLAGSHFVEWLTDRMEEKIREARGEIRDMGGIVRAVAEGTVQAKLAHQAYEVEKKLRSGETPKVGVNRHVAESASKGDVELHPYDEAAAAKQVERLRKVRAGRAGAAVKSALDAVRAAAAEGRNVMPAVVDAVKAYATVGEVVRAMKDVFGAYREPVRL